MHISDTMYKDQRAICLESDHARFLFLPDTGANLASAYSKPLQKEYLVQRPEPKYLRQPFDGVYVDAECSGMDDMFPTIDRCHYERFPWSGVPLADHAARDTLHTPMRSARSAPHCCKYCWTPFRGEYAVPALAG